jgi:hypothetical protein
MEKIVSLLYNKEKVSNAFFGKNVNILVHFFVYGFRLTFAVLPNSEQSYKGKVKTHKFINRQNQSTTGKL